MLQLNRPTVEGACELTWVKGESRYLHRQVDFVQMRDVRQGAASPVVQFTRRDWSRFQKVAHRLQPAVGGGYRLGDLFYRTNDWDAFCAAIRVNAVRLPSRARHARLTPAVVGV